MLDEDETENDNMDMLPSGERAQRSATQGQVGELIRKRFRPLPRLVKDEEDVKFERVLVFDIYKDTGSGLFRIQILDIDNSVNGTKFPEKNDATTAHRQEIAQSLYEEQLKPLQQRIDIGLREIDKLSHIKLEDAIGTGFKTASSDFSGFSFPSVLANEFKLSDQLKDLPPIERVLLLPIDVYPSIFDIEFKGPTALIVRSNVENFHFRPDPFHFRNQRDSIYYRNQNISEDLKTISIINAYNDGSVKPDANGKYPRRATPDNQEHKVDFQMIQSQWGKHPLTGEERWLMLPIIVDPPLNNGGGD